MRTARHRPTRTRERPPIRCRSPNSARSRVRKRSRPRHGNPKPTYRPLRNSRTSPRPRRRVPTSHSNKPPATTDLARSSWPWRSSPANRFRCSSPVRRSADTRDRRPQLRRRVLAVALTSAHADNRVGDYAAAMPDRVELSTSNVRTDDWPAQATDSIVKVVGTVHDKVTGPDDDGRPRHRLRNLRRHPRCRGASCW